MPNAGSTFWDAKVTKQNKGQTKEKNKTWFNEKLELEFKEFENENFRFSYLVWARKGSS